MKKQQNR